MKKVRIRSAAPIYMAAAVWALVGIIRPGMLLKMGTLAITILLSAAAYFAGTKIFKDKVIEVREPVSTGNAEIDRQIAESRKSLDALTVYDAKIPDPTVSKYLERMHKTIDKRMAAELLKSGKVRIKDLYSAKKNMYFEADLIMDANGERVNFSLEFPSGKSSGNHKKK